MTGTRWRHADGEHILTVAPRSLLRPGVAIASYGPGGFRVHNLSPTCVRELVDTLLAILEAEADTERREGMPLTGRTVAGALGEICASYAAVAHAAEVLAEQMLILAEAVRES
jgi:hypothetical protein